MKTKKPAFTFLSLKLLLVLPLIILMLISLSSCSAGRKAARTTIEVAPPPPPPPAAPQRPVPGQKEGDAYLVVDEMPVFPGGDEALLKIYSRKYTIP